MASATSFQSSTLTERRASLTRKRHANIVYDLDSSKATSLKVFRKFLVYNPDGTIDASKIHSRDCYEMWLASRKTDFLVDPEKNFQRTLSSHLTAVDGRTPFEPTEEAAILEVIRKKERWPCFANSTVRYGYAGYRAKGFHEKKQDTPAESEATSSLKRCQLDASQHPLAKRQVRADAGDYPSITSYQSDHSESSSMDGNNDEVLAVNPSTRLMTDKPLPPIDDDELFRPPRPAFASENSTFPTILDFACETFLGPVDVVNVFDFDI